MIVLHYTAFLFIYASLSKDLSVKSPQCLSQTNSISFKAHPRGRKAEIKSFVGRYCVKIMIYILTRHRRMSLLVMLKEFDLKHKGRRWTHTPVTCELVAQWIGFWTQDQKVWSSQNRFPLMIMCRSVS